MMSRSFCWCSLWCFLFNFGVAAFRRAVPLDLLEFRLLLCILGTLFMFAGSIGMYISLFWWSWFKHMNSEGLCNREVFDDISFLQTDFRYIEVGVILQW